MNSSAAMAKLLVALLFFLTLEGVAATQCSYQLFPDMNYRTASCSYGCCYTMIYPCCSAPFYIGASFIAPMVIGSIVLTIIIIVVAIISVRRRRIRTTIQYGAPYGQPQFMTTTTAANSYGSYNNQAYPAPPTYSTQPPRY